MRLKASGNTERLGYMILCVCIITGALTSFLMLRIDSIIHVQLYDYGLQFSTEWADAYWTAARMIYVLLTLPMILSIIIIIYKLARSRKEGTGFLAKLKSVPLNEKQPAAYQPKLQIGTVVQEEDELMSLSTSPEPEQSKEVKEKPKLQVGNGLLISCPNCSKVFNRPLVMLDFSSGKTRLVNICPYCNHNLGEAFEQRRSEISGN